MNTTAAIAPKGQEGTYLGLSLIPWFLAKTVVSYFSGNLLNRWAPETVTVDGAQVTLQQAMIDGKLSYWDRPRGHVVGPRSLGGRGLCDCNFPERLDDQRHEGAVWSKGVMVGSGGPVGPQLRRI